MTSYCNLAINNITVHSGIHTLGAVAFMAKFSHRNVGELGDNVTSLGDVVGEIVTSLGDCLHSGMDTVFRIINFFLRAKRRTAWGRVFFAIVNITLIHFYYVGFGRSLMGNIFTSWIPSSPNKTFFIFEAFYFVTFPPFLDVNDVRQTGMSPFRFCVRTAGGVKIVTGS